MTKLLQKAFDEAAKLPPAEQDLLASRVLAELGKEDEFDRAIAQTADRLAAFLEGGSRRAPRRLPPSNDAVTLLKQVTSEFSLPEIGFAAQ